MPKTARKELRQRHHNWGRVLAKMPSISTRRIRHKWRGLRLSWRKMVKLLHQVQLLEIGWTIRPQLAAISPQNHKVLKTDLSPALRRRWPTQTSPRVCLDRRMLQELSHCRTKELSIINLATQIKEAWHKDLTRMPRMPSFRPRQARLTVMHTVQLGQKRPKMAQKIQTRMGLWKRMRRVPSPGDERPLLKSGC